MAGCRIPAVLSLRARLGSKLNYLILVAAFFQVLDTFHEMVRKGCERSVITYSSLINACEKAGRWELALHIFNEMRRENCAPNLITYNSLISACS